MGPYIFLVQTGAFLRPNHVLPFASASTVTQCAPPCSPQRGVMRIRQHTHSTQDPGTELYTAHITNAGEYVTPTLPKISVLPNPITLRQGGDVPAASRRLAAGT